MSNELWFTENHRDLSNAYGQDAGFEFEFYCQRCGDTWRSGFESYGLGRASGWLRRGAEMARGVTSNLGYDMANAADGLAQSGWHKARDNAFQRATASASAHFHRCGRCHNHVCDKCWSEDRGLCLGCAPDLQAEVEQARAQGQVAAARENAYAVGQDLAATVDVTTLMQVVCPQCRAETHGGKFCPSCGHRLGQLAACPSCSEPVPAGAKFCPECGTGV